MINKFFKKVNNKYSNFFSFFFFLRYLFLIFLVAIISFISIPKFFDYEKKQKNIEKYLIGYYDLELNNYSSIHFEIFPFPNLSIKDASLKVKNEPIKFSTKNFKVFLKIKDIYNYDNFTGKKLLLSNNKVSLDIDKTNNLLNYFSKLKYKLDIQKLNLNLKKKENSILVINNINFSNYGFNKNKINGEIFDKKFEVSINNKSRNLEFKILRTGINANFYLNDKIETETISGSSRITVLKNNFKSNFVLRDNEISINEGNLSNKNFSVFFNSSIKFNPFFEFNSNININKMNKKFINNLSLEKILKQTEIIKKLNSNNKVTYNTKRLYNSFINNHYSELNLAHGRLVFSNKMSIAGGIVNCKGDSLLIEEYPRLNFECFIDLKNKKEFLKKFSISEKLINNSLKLEVVGSLNLFNKKINLKKIGIDEKDDTVNKEDLNYFKETFENVLFNENFFSIFRKDKVKEFLLEII